MLPLKFINELIWSCLAMAWEMYPVDVISFNFEANHPHLILRVLDPQDVSRFLGYFKQEISHRLNRLLGRRKKTNWCKGYASPVVLDRERVLQEIAYGMTNPVKDHLVFSLDEYVGVSSWKMFRDKNFVRACRATSRVNIPKLRDPHRPWKEERQVFQWLKQHNETEIFFEISPYAWKNCFEDTRDLPDEKIHEMMIVSIREEERRHQDMMVAERKIPPPVERLKRQSLLRAYSPKKFGRKMICVSNCRDLRQKFILAFKSILDKAREVYRRWKLGDFSVAYPPGIFAPPLPRLAEQMPVFY